MANTIIDWDAILRCSLPEDMYGLVDYSIEYGRMMFKLANPEKDRYIMVHFDSTDPVDQVVQDVLKPAIESIQ